MRLQPRKPTLFWAASRGAWQQAKAADSALLLCSPETHLSAVPSSGVPSTRKTVFINRHVEREFHSVFDELVLNVFHLKSSLYVVALVSKQTPTLGELQLKTLTSLKNLRKK